MWFKFGMRECSGCRGPELRPCEVDGKPALFHRFIEEDKALLRINTYCRPDEQQILVRCFHDEGVCSNICSTEIIRNTWALVEYSDGSVGKVDPALVTFLDRNPEM